MSLSPEQLDIIADKYVAELYQNMEQEVINDIAMRVQKMGRFTETAELMAKSMREQGYSTGKIQAEVMKVLNADPKYQRAIAENTKAYKQEIKEIIAETVAEAKANGNRLIAEAGTMAWNDDMQMWKEHNVDLKKDNQLDQLYKAFQKQTAGQLVNITRTSCISDQYGDTAIMDRFRKEMDLAVLKITTGTWSYEQALGDCIKRMGATGMKVKYAGGRKMQADSYARMCVRTACSQLAGKVTEMNMNKTGQELVYVSAHTGARPTHAVWQGQVYYWSKAKPVPGYDYFVDATDYGDVTGLKGVNCSHEFYPYWEGTAIPKFKEAPNVKVDGKTYTKYEATQQQRAMERGIRATKRQLEATKATNGDTSILQAQLNNQMAKYTDFSNKAGLRVQDGRIGNFNAIRSRNVKKKVNATNVVKNIKKTIAAKVQKTSIKGLSTYKCTTVVGQTLENSKIAYHEIKKNLRDLSIPDIINKIGGGDKTVGSCSSLAFAYIGNRNGCDVLDFRNGESCDFFATTKNIMDIANIPGVKSVIVREYSDIKATAELFKNITEDGKEYYFTTGAHAAVVRYVNGIGYQYMELQTEYNNGYQLLGMPGTKQFNDKLKSRFGAKASHTTHGLKYSVRSCIIEADSLKDNQEFHKILGYINTPAKKQVKGAGGYAK